MAIAGAATGFEGIGGGLLNVSKEPSAALDVCNENNHALML